MCEITRQEKNSILYYQGGGDKVILTEAEEKLREFYNISDAYQMLNALLMPGISNEIARMKDEGRNFYPDILENMDELVNVYCRLYSAVCKYTYYHETKDNIYTYRIDRMNTLEFLNDGQMFSFMSTSLVGGEKRGLQDKDGILLLEIDVPSNIEHIDINDVLGEKSKYPKEKEILIAPFILLNKEQLSLTKKELTYKDMHKKPPQAKYRLNLLNSAIVPLNIPKDSDELTQLLGQIKGEDSLKNAKEVWEMLMGEKNVDDSAIDAYISWKEKLQRYLKIRFSAIKWEVMSGTTQEKRLLGKLKDNIQRYSAYVNERRKRNEKRLLVSNIILCVVIFAIAISLLMPDVLFGCVNTNNITLALAALATLVVGITKCFSWGEKFKQATTIYLLLDELSRDMDYSICISQEILVQYIEQFKNIVKQDNLMCLNNTDAIIHEFSMKASSFTDNKG